MINLLVLAVLFSCLAFYNSAQQKSKYKLPFLEKWMQKNVQQTKIAGVISLLASLIIATYTFGFTAGVLFWSVILMSMLSLLILIKPLHVVGYKQFALLFAFTLTLEFIF